METDILVTDLKRLVPNISVFEFEKTLNYHDYRRWMKPNFHLCFYVVGIYLITIFGGRFYMSSRKPFNLRPLLLVWNAFLAMFSISCVIRFAPDFWHVW